MHWSSEVDGDEECCSVIPASINVTPELPYSIEHPRKIARPGVHRMRQVDLLEGVDMLKAAGVMHRDLKADNTMAVQIGEIWCADSHNLQRVHIELRNHDRLCGCTVTCPWRTLRISYTHLARRLTFEASRIPQTVVHAVRRGLILDLGSSAILRGQLPQPAPF